MNDNNIKCMYFNHRFTEKPQGKQCGWVQKSLTQADITIENLADALVNGATFKPAVLVGGNKAENWYQQQLFGLDFDDGIRIEEAKHISAKYGFKKIVNFYQIEEYGFTTLENSEKIAGTLIENNISLKGLSREYILRTFGIETADRVFPQYKYENRQGTSAKSDYLTGEIASVVLNTIKEQGYIFERDVNINGAIGTQWKKSIQEILDSYGLKKVKLNKELKEKYGMNALYVLLITRMLGFLIMVDH